MDGTELYEDSGTRSALKQAQGYYEDAVRKDPTFALAYAGLGDCYLDQGAYRLVPPQVATWLWSWRVEVASLAGRLAACFGIVPGSRGNQK